MNIIDKKLKNGVALSILSSPEFKSSKITVKFNAGYLSEPIEKNQIPHILEHIIYDFEESDREWAAEVGAIKNAQTWDEYTRYFIEVLPEYFEKSVDILLRSIENPKITRESFEREVKNVRSEFTTRRKDGLPQVYNEKLVEIFTNGVSRQRCIDSLENITLADIERHYREFYTTDNARVFVFGDFSNDNIVMIENKLEDLKLPRGEEKTFPEIEITDNRGAKIIEDDDKIHYILLTPVEDMKHNLRQRATFSVLRKMLTDYKSGRMYREIRDRGLLYHIFWSVQENQNSTYFTEFAFSSDKETYADLMDVIEKWVDWVRNGDFSDEDLRKARIATKNDFRMDNRKIENIVEWYQYRALDFGQYVADDLIGEFDSVSREDIIGLAREAFEYFEK